MAKVTLSAIAQPMSVERAKRVAHHLSYVLDLASKDVISFLYIRASDVIKYVNRPSSTFYASNNFTCGKCIIEL